MEEQHQMTNKECVAHMRNQIFTIYKHPMKSDHMKDVFKWAASCCMTVGDCSWISVDQTWSDDDCKMFSLVARQSINELILLLPFLKRHLTHGNEPEIEGGKILERSANSDDYDSFATHLIIIESVIKSLVTHEVDDRLVRTLKGEEIRTLLHSLKEIIGYIIDYLELVHKYWLELISTHPTNTTTDKCNPTEEKLDSAKAALRIVCVWFSECPGTFEPECKRFLLDLIVKNLLIEHEAPNSDLFILALHSICAEDDDLLSHFNKLPNQKLALESYLQYIEQEKSTKNRSSSRMSKEFKLRCGMVKDLLCENRSIR